MCCLTVSSPRLSPCPSLCVSRLLFVDSGIVAVSAAPVRPLPGRWSLDKFAPVALFVRLADSAPAGTRDALLREENAMSLRLLQPAAGGGVDRVAGHITTPTGISATVTVSSCRGLLGQLGGAAPALAPADTETVSQRPPVAALVSESDCADQFCATHSCDLLFWGGRGLCGAYWNTMMYSVRCAVFLAGLSMPLYTRVKSVPSALWKMVPNVCAMSDRGRFCSDPSHDLPLTRP